MKRSFAKIMPVLKVTGSEFVRENLTNWMKQCICGTQKAISGALIQEEALSMKENMIETNPELDGFHASNGVTSVL